MLRNAGLGVLCAYIAVLGMGAAMKQSPTEQKTWRLLFSGEQLGHLEPCGCTAPQVGGMPRLSTLLEKYKGDPNALFVNNGDLTADSDEQSQLKLFVLMLYFQKLGYAAVNLGENDLKHGVETLQEHQMNYKVPLLCGNVVESATGTHPFTTSITKNGLTIVGVIAETYSNAVEAANPGYELQPVASVLSSVDRAKGPVVLLFHGDKSQAEAVAKANPWLTAIVYGHSDSWGEPYKVGNVSMLDPGADGKIVGEARITKDGVTVVPVSLGPSFADSEQTKPIRDIYLAELKDKKFLQNFPKMATATGATYVGNEACYSCHQEDARIWKASKHSHAMHTLEVVKHEVDPECVSCHSVGFKYKSGYVDQATTPKLADVGCESCHGPGSAHVKNTKLPLKANGEKACEGCHKLENSPNFEFKKYWEKIKH